MSSASPSAFPWSRTASMCVTSSRTSGRSRLAPDPPPDPTRAKLPDQGGGPLVADVLTASDLQIYPSRPYCVSRSLVEAMAAGCVILAWDSPAVREFIAPNQTGLIVPPDDPEAAERLARKALSDLGFRPAFGSFGRGGTGPLVLRSGRNLTGVGRSLRQFAHWNAVIESCMSFSFIKRFRLNLRRFGAGIA